MLDKEMRADLEREARKRWPQAGNELREQLRQQIVAPKVVADRIRATGGTPVVLYRVLADLIESGVIPVDAHPERAGLDNS
jgi:hypothetical protein